MDLWFWAARYGVKIGQIHLREYDVLKLAKYTSGSMMCSKHISRERLCVLLTDLLFVFVFVTLVCILSEWGPLFLLIITLSVFNVACLIYQSLL